jgi:glycerol-3-phosphate dehydrogenase (NAD(P)+)
VQTIAILGAGSWGTSLAVHLARTGHAVRLWGRDAALIAKLGAERENALYLAGIRLEASVQPTVSLGTALSDATLVVVAIPSHGLRPVLHQAVSFLATSVPIVSTVKGIEHGTWFRMSEVIADESGPERPVVVLSGPTFALEVARGLPAAVTIASKDAGATALVQSEFRSPAIRLYGTDDVVGVEVGGALKNVIAIAAGVVESLGLGANATAALITRGLAEISRLAMAMGGKRETLAGLSGLGDLVLTCTGGLSRNRQLGIEIGSGRSVADVVASTKMVAEGVRTARAALALGERYGVELPIIRQMHEVIEGQRSPQAALAELMLRPQKAE